ncbi:MAG TPA: hypothetical protein VI072_15485 [Polyangiaceae bacterium]
MSRRSTGGLLAAVAAILAALVLPSRAESQPKAPEQKPGSAPAGAGAAQPGATPAAGGTTAAATPTGAAPAGATLCKTTRRIAVSGKLKSAAKPPPRPTPAQLRALALLSDEAKEYEKGAKEFRDTLTMIVRHHYEERRRRVLSALDREIATEKKGLEDARDTAIQRLEQFIATYSGDNAHPSATPDAMFRLAALYEERGRAQQTGEIETGLEPAINLYRRIIREYPKYEEIAAVHYFLGHAYTDSARLEEGQQAWRTLVCANKYQVKDDPADAGKIQVQSLPQDHDEKFWTEWYNAHPVPLDQTGRGNAAKAPVKPVARRGVIGREELGYVDPYAACTPLPQPTDTADEPRYLAEIWWQLGNFHFDQIDPKAGPYNLNRAVSAYDYSLRYKKPPIYGVAMYKQAWTFFKQQRYRTATDWFVRLLHYTDEQEAKTGDPGADFRAEAYTYIAGSLTYVDNEGPPADHPYIPRNDVLDTETDPVVAEQKMAIAIERVQDPKLIPQDKKWSVEIYKSLAQEFIEITQNRNAIATLELTLKKYPMNRDAPVMQNKVAELYDQLSRLAPEGSEARAEYGAKALEARTKLASYVGTTPWTDANRDDPEALSQAELLVRGGVKRAAADHTNSGRSFYEKALELNDADEQKLLLRKAVDEYRMAETAWAAYLEQDPQAQDTYESKFWLADARYWSVVLQVTVGQTPTAAEVQCAREAAIEVRDSNEDDKYIQPAGYYVVTIAEKVLEDLYRQHEESNGARGLEKRDELRFSGEGDQRKPIKDPIPQPVMDAIQARDEYNARIPLERDPQRNGLLYAFQAGDMYFVYGHFDEAKKRFRPIYEANCGKNEFGYKAWEKLVSMANFELKTEESRKLVEGKSCAYNEDTKASEENLRKPVMQGLAYQDARALYEQAEKMPDGPERQKKWREAAAKYKAALDAAPGRDEAPEAAMNGAYAYKQVGEYDKAIEMYELFLSRYGDEKALQRLRNGDPAAKPPVAPDRQKYETRVKYVKNAYDALAGAYVLFFNYPRAADTFDKISTHEHFQQKDRREAARQALSLYASLGDRGGMERSRERFLKLGASPKEAAEVDYIVASSELKKWDQFSPDTGANANARRSAQRAMDDYYARNRNNAAAAEYVVRAAYYSAKTRKAVNAPDTNKNWQNTMAAFENWRRQAPQKDGRSSALGSAEAGMAAEAEYTMLDEEITRKFDYETGHQRFKGTPVEVINQYKKASVEAKAWYDRLQKVVDTYVSPEWATTAVARQGSLYDSLRTGLYNVRPPELKMFDAKQERLLKSAEESDNLELQEKADAIRVQVQQAWRDRREQEINSADNVMVDRYATAVVLARRYNVSSGGVTRALRRLAFFTDIIGEAKMKQYTANVKDLNYTEGMFTKMRPGQVTAPPPQGTPPPLPVVGQ